MNARSGPTAVQRPAGRAPAPRTAGVVRVREPETATRGIAAPWERQTLGPTTRKLISPDGAASARVSSALLGGKDHWTADRAAAGRLCDAAPDWAQNGAAARLAVLAMAAAAAAHGIDQFTDLGCGLTTGPAGTALAPLHTAVLTACPAANVVYVDRDPMAMAHVRALLRPNAPTTVRHVHADLTAPAPLLAALRDEAGPRRKRPVAAVLSDVLHELTDDQAHRLLEALRATLPAGSVLLLTHRAPGDRGTGATVADAHAQSALAWHPRDAGQVAALAAGWQPLPWAPTGQIAGFTTLTVAPGRWAA
ncbi:SAM-dependent methyltransferase [Kitasatospora sp. NPDC059327]|uniref:SAM-dependent methyltransferase n=1 Tax=Kitasatospora sp. NPDC059327 TaxID=3346803 RepID=UPI003697E51C